MADYVTVEPALDLRFGDCLAVLRTLPDASVDAVVTDPPYGLADHKPAQVTAAVVAWAGGDREVVPSGRGFMGRDWDAFVPPPAVWDECLRVLKPGGHLVAFAGSRTYDLMGLSIRMAGFEIRDGLAWLYSTGFPKSKTVLKPAQEPMILARAPFRGSEVANLATHGTGALAIEACRVGTGGHLTWAAPRGLGYHGNGTDAGPVEALESTQGRWPANVLFSHGEACADECVPGCPVAELDAQSGTSTSKSGGVSGTKSNNGLLNNTGERRTDPRGGHDDQGGASRFFPVFRYQAKAPGKERPKIDGQGHPTVKPLALMEWVVRLVTPEGGTVLDPFAGTGTTLDAARRQGFASIGVERWDLAYRLACQRLGLPDVLPKPVLDEPAPLAAVPDLEPDPVPVDPILDAIADAVDEQAALEVWRLHAGDWTDVHTEAVRARLPELRAAS